MRHFSYVAIVGIMLGPMLAADPSYAQAARTWVSGVGDDVNPCSRTAPCKTFATTMSKTAAGGTINCMDSGGFGAVTITKSLTIDCAGTLAGILAPGSNGVNVNAPGIQVTLRNLSIDGAGTGLIGVSFINGSSLTIENCHIYGFRAGTAMGIRFTAPTGIGTELNVINTTVQENGTAATNGGIVINAVGNGVAKVSLKDVRILNNSTGLRMDGTGSTGGIRVDVQNTVASNNFNVGFHAVTVGGGAGVVAMLKGSAASGNTTGIHSDGPGADIIVGSTSSTLNVTGVSFANGALLRTYGNNQTNANVNNGVFSARLDLQ